MPHENSTQHKPADLIEQLVGQAISLDELLAPAMCWRVRKALLLIHAAPQLDWNCEDFAELFHLNADYFSRQFIAEAGSGVSHYLEVLRVAKARHLMKTSDLFLHQIAHKVGMPNELALRRAFKRRYGVTPSSCYE